MKKFVITIGREFGCNAREIGRQLAARLGVPFYDKELVDRAAELAGVNADFYSKSDEHPGIKEIFFTEFGTTLNAFVYAPLPYRIKHIAKAYGLSEKDAQKMIKQIDRRRHNDYRYVTGKNRGDRHGRNIMIDVEMFGVEGAVELIYQAVCQRFKI